MAKKLPSAFDRPTLRIDKSVHTAQGVGRADEVAAQAYRAEGAAVAEIGNQVDLYVEGLDQAAYSSASTGFLQDKIAIDLKYDQNVYAESGGHDPDAPANYAKEIEAARNRRGAGLYGKGARKFNADTNLSMTQGGAAVIKHTRTRHFTKVLGQLGTDLATERANGYRATTPAGRLASLNNARNLIESARKIGPLNAAQAAKMTEDYKTDYIKQTLLALTPKEQQKRLQVPDGWTPSDKLPTYAKTGTITDQLNEADRVAMARDLSPELSSQRAVELRDTAQKAHPGQVEEQVEFIRKNGGDDAAAIKEATANVKADWSLARTVRSDNLDRDALALYNLVAPKFTDSEARANAIRIRGGDPKVVAAAIALSDKDAARAVRERAYKQKQQFEATSAKVDAGQPLTADDMSSLGPRDREWIKKLQQYTALTTADPDYDRKGDDGTTWGKYIQASSDPSFADMSFGKLRKKYELGVTKTVWEKTILPEWRAARISAGKKVDKAAEKAGPSGWTNSDRVKALATDLGINIKANKGKDFLRLKREFDRRVVAENADTNAAKNAVADQMLKEKFIYAGGMWNSTAFVSTITDDELKELADFEKIPKAQHDSFIGNFKAITDYLRIRGEKRNRANIMRVWKEGLAKAAARKKSQ
jgi:hypothetical protein